MATARSSHARRPLSAPTTMSRTTVVIAAIAMTHRTIAATFTDRKYPFSGGGRRTGECHQVGDDVRRGLDAVDGAHALAGVERHRLDFAGGGRVGRHDRPARHRERLSA